MNINARSNMTHLTIQCDWLNNRGTSRFAASADAAENPGIVGNGDSMHDEPGSNHDGTPPARPDRGPGAATEAGTQVGKSAEESSPAIMAWPRHRALWLTAFTLLCPLVHAGC